MLKKLLLYCLLLTMPALAWATNCQPSAFTVRGKSLSPALEQGNKVAYVPLACISPKHKDLIIFKTSANKTAAPVIKQIAGMAGDTLNFTKDGTVLINNKPAQTPAGTPYQAHGRSLRMLKLYEGTIPKDRFLVLGNSGTLDSSRIGLIHSNQVIGVAPLSKNHIF